MPSKYADVVRRLTPGQPDDPVYQSRVQALKDKLTAETAFTPSTLGQRYAKLRAEKDEINSLLSDVNLRIAAFEQLLIETHEAANAEWGQYGASGNALRLVTGDKIEIDKQPVGKVVDKEKFRLWCIQNGYENQLQLWPSTMNSLVKERLVEGMPEPDGTEAHTRVTIKFTAAKL